MKRRLVAAIAAVPVALGFAACGGGDGGGDDPIELDGGTASDGGVADGGHGIRDAGSDADGGGDVPDGGHEQRPATSIGWCRVVNEPSSVTIENGGTFTAYAQVFAAGRTEGVHGADTGVRGQMGVGTVGSDVSGWTWTDADFNAYFADGNNDEYMGSYSSTTPGTVAYAFRFQVDGGEWFYCDTDGHVADDPSQGFDASSLATITVQEVQEAPKPHVEWCKVMNEPSSITTDTEGGASAYAQVYVPGRTEGEHRADSGVEAQMGTGAVGSDPASAAEWSWLNASNNDLYSGNANHDEYMATFSSETPVTVAYAFRFRVDGGEWFYCDADGHSASNEAEGFSVSSLGVITIKEKEEAPKPRIDWCRIVNDPSSATIENGGSFSAYAQVYSYGVTEGAYREDSGVTGQMGVGAKGTDPAGAGWKWSDAAYNAGFADGLGNNYEFVASYSSTTPGTVSYAYRFKVDGGEWFYCDTDGHSAALDDFDPAALGTITVKEKPVEKINWCRVVNEPSSVAIENGGSFTAYAQVYSHGRTEGAYSEESGVEGQMGFGPVGSDPAADDSAWTWADAAYNAEFGGALGSNYEYMGTYASTAAGTVAYTFRFRLDGEAWFYCDTDGHSADNANEPYDAGMLGTITVKEEVKPGIDWCRVVNEPASVTIENGGSFTAYAQVYSAGRTEGAYSESSGIEGQMGVGASGTDPTSGNKGWTWTDARYNENFGGAEGNNYEYMADFSSTEGGTKAYAFRFRLDGGDWFYCDADGHSAIDEAGQPFSAESLGTITVQDRPVVKIGWCRVINEPSDVTIENGGTFTAYGQVYARNRTEALVDDAGSGIEAALCVDGKCQTSATFDRKSGNDLVYKADFSSTKAGTVDYGYRFRVDGGDWFYCGPNGASADVDGEAGNRRDVGKITVEAAVEPPTAVVDWCDVEPSVRYASSYAAVTATSRVYVQGLTESGNAGSQRIRAQVGWGSAGSDPTASGASWRWSDARINDLADAQTLGNNFEYVGEVPAAASDRSFAFRYSLDNGPWLYCDTDGHSSEPSAAKDAFDAAKLGSVRHVDDLSIDWCRMQWPDSNTEISAGETFDAYGHVYVGAQRDGASLTGSSNGYLDDPAIEAQIGLVPGSETVDVRNYSNVAAYWHDAAVNQAPGASTVQALGTANSEYEAHVSGLAKGRYSFAFRFRIKGGNDESWLYCGAGDSTQGPNNLFRVEHIRTLTVK